MSNSAMSALECCICCSNSTDLFLDEKSGQPDASMLQYPCCNRVICPICLDKIPRFEDYCPYCQHTGSSSSSRESFFAPGPVAVAVPAKANNAKDPEKVEQDAPDVLHFVDPANDTINLLSIRYGVPASVLRTTNNIFSDHLLAARKTILISGEYYKGGVSLSPRPVEGEEMELRKNKIRRWMVACKSADYDQAGFYLDQAQWKLDDAVAAFKQDEVWEKANPLKGKQPPKKKLGFW